MMQYWLQELGPDDFSKMICGSLAKRMNDDDLFMILNDLLSTLGQKKFVKLVGQDAVSSRILDTYYLKTLKIWLKELGLDNFSRIFNAGFAERVLLREVLEHMNNFCPTLFHYHPSLYPWKNKKGALDIKMNEIAPTHMTVNQLCQFMGTYANARHLIDDGMKERFVFWIDKLGMKNFLTMFCKGTATYIAKNIVYVDKGNYQNSYENELLKWYSYLVDSNEQDNGIKRWFGKDNQNNNNDDDIGKNLFAQAVAIMYCHSNKMTNEFLTYLAKEKTKGRIWNCYAFTKLVSHTKKSNVHGEDVWEKITPKK
jgi:hypothetical protein